MIEAEMKFRLDDAPRLIDRLREEFGAEFGTEFEENDLYFQHFGRDFRQTDEALRIRQTGRELRITYKGPKLDAETKTREEIELPLSFFDEKSGKKDEKAVHALRDDWTRLLTRLGFLPAATVLKMRRAARISYEGLDFIFTLDRFEEIGEFVEIETQVTEPAALESARDRMKRLAEKLSLGDSIRVSYLEMLTEHRENA